MAKRNYKYNNTVDLSNLIYKTKRNYVDWKASIGKIIPFTFNDGKLVGEFTIIDYKTPNDAVNPHVYLEYLGNELKPILPQGLKNATISQILDEYYIIRTAWLYGWTGRNFVYTMIKAINANSKIKVVNDQKGSPTFAGDLADIIIRIIKNKVVK